MKYQFIPLKKGKGGDNKRTKGEHLDSIENKRARLGGPACMPESWRNRDPSSMIMSFNMPVQGDGSMMIFYQANSQLPAFGRYVLCGVGTEFPCPNWAERALSTTA